MEANKKNTIDSISGRAKRRKLTITWKNIKAAKPRASDDANQNHSIIDLCEDSETENETISSEAPLVSSVHAVIDLCDGSDSETEDDKVPSKSTRVTSDDAVIDLCDDSFDSETEDDKIPSKPTRVSSGDFVIDLCDDSIFDSDTEEDKIPSESTRVSSGDAIIDLCDDDNIFDFDTVVNKKTSSDGILTSRDRLSLKRKREEGAKLRTNACTVGRNAKAFFSKALSSISRTKPFLPSIDPSKAAKSPSLTPLKSIKNLFQPRMATKTHAATHITPVDAARLIQGRSKPLIVLTTDASGGACSGMAAILRKICPNNLLDSVRVVLGRNDWGESAAAEIGAVAMGVKELLKEEDLKHHTILILIDCKAAIQFFGHESSCRAGNVKFGPMKDSSKWMSDFQYVSAKAQTVFLGWVKSNHSSESGFFDHEAADLLAARVKCDPAFLLHYRRQWYRNVPILNQESLEWLVDAAKLVRKKVAERMAAEAGRKKLEEKNPACEPRRKGRCKNRIRTEWKPFYF